MVMIAGEQPTVTETKVDVTVVRLRVMMLRVKHPRGYQLVVGGRLLLDEMDGVKTPHPDLPPYRMDDFPMPLLEWTGEESQPVWVERIDGGKTRRIGQVRACTYLFTPISAEVVKAWLRRGGEG